MGGARPSPARVCGHERGRGPAVRLPRSPARVPTTDPVVLDSPLAGEWYVYNEGRSVLLNGHSPNESNDRVKGHGGASRAPGALMKYGQAQQMGSEQAHIRLTTGSRHLRSDGPSSSFGVERLSALPCGECQAQQSNEACRRKVVELVRAPKYRASAIPSPWT
jgi:hypothetical protein